MQRDKCATSGLPIKKLSAIDFWQQLTGCSKHNMLLSPAWTWQALLTSHRSLKPVIITCPLEPDSPVQMKDVLAFSDTPLSLSNYAFFRPRSSPF